MFGVLKYPRCRYFSLDIVLPKIRSCAKLEPQFKVGANCPYLGKFPIAKILENGEKLLKKGVQGETKLDSPKKLRATMPRLRADSAQSCFPKSVLVPWRSLAASRRVQTFAALLNYLFSENVFGQIINSLSKNTQLREIGKPENLQFYEKVILLNYLLSSNVTGQMLLGKIRNCAKFLSLRTYNSTTFGMWDC